MGDAPIADAPLGRKQRGVAIGAGCALAVTIGLFLLPPHLRPFETPPRAQIWGTATLGPLFCLLAAVGAVANTRFFSRADIDAAAGGAPSETVRRLQAILQNTLEQAVLAIGTYGALSVFLPREMVMLPMVMAAAFVVGRIAFAAGYRKGAAGRAFGFGLTAYPTFFGLGYAAYLAARWWAH